MKDQVDNHSIFDDDMAPKVVRYFMLKGATTELFAQVEDHPSNRAGTHVRLYEPLQIFTAPQAYGPDEQAIILHEWIPFLDKDYVDVPRDGILIDSSVKPEMTVFYNKVAKKFRDFVATSPVRIVPSDQIPDIPQMPKGLMDLASLDPTKGDFLENFAKIMDTMDPESKERLRSGTAEVLGVIGAPALVADDETAEEKLKKGNKALAEIAEAMKGKKGETIH